MTSSSIPDHTGFPCPGRFLGHNSVAPDFSEDEVGRSVPERFEKRAKEHPERVAVIDGNSVRSYGDVLSEADRIAQVLLHLMGPEPAPVAILYDIEGAMVPAIYGILAAGKFYVPLDPASPPARLRQLLEDTGCRVLLTRGPLHAAAEPLARNGIHLLDTDRLPASAAVRMPPPNIGPEAHAYIIYTSGSTGRPKGVIQTHANVLFDMRRQGQDLGVVPEDRYGLLFSAASSASACSLFGALLNGAALSCYDIRRRGIGPMSEWFSGHGISICDISVATLRLFAATLTGTERFPGMRMIAPGGEPLYRHDIELCRRVFGEGCVVQNSLGTTETRTATQYFIHRDLPVDDALVPVGYPVSGKDVLLWDSEGRESDEGELVIRSRYLSPGYWGQPELTAAVFQPVPGAEGVRTYRTGDLGRRLSDGRLVHLGRKDFQVKIHGYRVEVAEVENVLLASPGIEDVAVVARPGPDGSACLIAFLVPRPDASLTVAGLRSACAAVLPSYAIPSEFRQLPSLPKTGNGKLDRKLLTESGVGEELLPTASLPPRNDVERSLCSIWERVLGRTGIGIGDDFFMLGGNSVAAMSCLLEVEKRFGRRLDPSAFVPTATLARLAELLGENSRTDANLRVIPLNLGGTGTPLYLVHSIFGSLLHYRQWLAAGSFDRPVFGVQCPTTFDPGTAPASMEDLAGGYVACLRAFQPKGPYALAGHSFGGALAFEIARQLEASGERVSFLGLIDTGLHLPPTSPKPPRATVAAFLRNLPHWTADRWGTRPVHRRWIQWRHRLATRRMPPEDRIFEFRDLAPELRRLAYRNYRIAAAYRPEPIRGTVHLFGARTRPLFEPHSPEHAWRSLAGGGVRYIELPGNHMSLLTEPDQASVFARAFAEALRSAA